MQDFSEFNEDCDALIAAIRNCSISCSWVETLPNERRFWKVNAEKNSLVDAFHKAAIRDYKDRTGHSPAKSFVMANHVWPSEVRLGSGGGWHADSFSGQFKSFLYLSAVTEESGPFEYIVPNFFVRFQQFIYRFLEGNNRYTAGFMKVCQRMSKTMTVTGSGLHYFFLKTNIPHRGAPVQKGNRFALTCYMFDKNVTKWDR